MKTQKHGIGIAAPQVGILSRLAIVNVSARVPGAEKLFLVNPTILAVWDEITSREGCMSIPDYMANIRRYKRIRLGWYEPSGALKTKIFEGIEAVCIQHEVDHLNGLLFIDRVASLKRDMIPRVR